MSDPVSSFISGNEQAKATKAAANRAAQSQDTANKMNFDMFSQSRGSEGSAVLPTYLKNQDGSLFESKLGSDLVDSYNRTATPLSTFQQAAGRTASAQGGALDLTNSIFNGGVTRKLQDNAAPVQAARIATARSSSLDALHKTLDSIDAAQAGRGYVGDSYGNRLLKFQAGRSAGDAVGAADIANKQQTADIKNYGDITLPMQNMTLPFSMAQQAGQAAFMPNDQYLQSEGQRMQPLNMLKLGVAQPFRYEPLPVQGATPSTLGIAAEAQNSMTRSVGSAVSSYANASASGGGGGSGGGGY